MNWAGWSQNCGPKASSIQLKGAGELCQFAADKTVRLRSRAPAYRERITAGSLVRGMPDGQRFLLLHNSVLVTESIMTGIRHWGCLTITLLLLRGKESPATSSTADVRLVSCSRGDLGAKRSTPVTAIVVGVVDRNLAITAHISAKRNGSSQPEILHPPRRPLTISRKVSYSSSTCTFAEPAPETPHHGRATPALCSCRLRT